MQAILSRKYPNNPVDLTLYIQHWMALHWLGGCSLNSPSLNVSDGDISRPLTVTQRL